MPIIVSHPEEFEVRIVVGVPEGCEYLLEAFSDNDMISEDEIASFIALLSALAVMRVTVSDK